MPPINWSLWLGVPGALGAFLLLWGSLGFPTLATGGDIQKLDRRQIDMAVEVYTTKQRSLIATAPRKDDTVAYEAWKKLMEQTDGQLDRAEKRKIELSK